MKKILSLPLLLAFFLALLLSGCSESGPRARAVYLLLDTSGTYTEEISKAQAIINYLLGTLNSGDSFAVARIDSGSFSEKDIIARVTFDDRPTTSNEQKRAIQQQINEFVKGVKRASNTDITGGMLQAVEYLNETGAGEKHILVFSDLEEDLQQGQVRDIAIPLRGVQVTALNVTKLRSDNIDPRDYLNRVDMWQRRVEEGGGNWKVINDLERFNLVLAKK